MSVPALNGGTTADGYTEANTVIFTFPRSGFALNISNASIFYQLAIPGSSGSTGDYTWDTLEHQLIPSLQNFDNPASEGFPGVRAFAGVRVRSAAVGTPANITVI